jgi:hypothetical protein
MPAFAVENRASLLARRSTIVELMREALDESVLASLRAVAATTARTRDADAWTAARAVLSEPLISDGRMAGHRRRGTSHPL